MVESIEDSEPIFLFFYSTGDESEASTWSISKNPQPRRASAHARWEDHMSTSVFVYHIG
jgi:hypothetical protein